MCITDCYLYSFFASTAHKITELLVECLEKHSNDVLTFNDVDLHFLQVEQTYHLQNNTSNMIKIMQTNINDSTYHESIQNISYSFCNNLQYLHHWLS